MVNMHLRNSSLDDCLSDDQFLSFLDHADVPPDFFFGLELLGSSPGRSALQSAK